MYLKAGLLYCVLFKTHYEFIGVMNGYKQREIDSEPSTCDSFVPPTNVEDLPDSVDWRTQGYVTPVKDQVIVYACLLEI